MGQPIVAVDLGAGRAFSSAVCGWRGGRVEALAIAPGIPSIEDQEKRDRVPTGTYQKLVASGHLRIAMVSGCHRQHCYGKLSGNHGELPSTSFVTGQDSTSSRMPCGALAPLSPG